MAINMTKDELKAKLAGLFGGDCAYCNEVATDLVDHAGETGKYAQNAKDRLDEMIGEIKHWENKHLEEGDYAKASVEAKKLSCLYKIVDRLK